MADKKISQLTTLAGGQLTDNDILPIVDVGAQQTKKITIETLRDDLYLFTNVWAVDSPPNETRGYIEYNSGEITYNPPNNDGIASAFVQGTGVNISKQTSGSDSGKYKIQIGQSVGAGDTPSFANLILNSNSNYLNITPNEIGANLNNQDSTGFAINNVTEINLKDNGSGSELEITASGITPTGSPQNFTISNATLNNVDIGTLSNVSITGGSISGVTLSANSGTLSNVSITGGSISGGSISGVTLSADSITLTPGSFNSLPASPAAGTRAFINDAVASPEPGWGDTITSGGGSTTVPVWYDGSNWRVG